MISLIRCAICVILLAFAWPSRAAESTKLAGTRNATYGLQVLAGRRRAPTSPYDRPVVLRRPVLIQPKPIRRTVIGPPMIDGTKLHKRP